MHCLAHSISRVEGCAGHGNYGKLLFFHSYECQGIQTKNPFDEILSLSFDLKPLRMNTYCVKKINFAKDYQKDSYNTNIFMGKKERIKTY